MLIDNTLVLSEEQAVTATAASTNVVDQKAAGNAHTHAALVVRVDETFAGATGVKIALETSAASGFGTKKEVFAVSPAVSALTKGATIVKTVLPAGLLRYIRGYYTITGTGTAGKLSMFITEAVDM
ncbi:MAG: hypothetical protein IKN49_03535 [Elusimicrobiaceae bacterium]|nr:hypothetical protein [Elusimicrobiaceae bacterium]